MTGEYNLKEQARRLEHAGRLISGALVSVDDVIEAFRLDPSLKARITTFGAAIAKASTVSLMAAHTLGITRIDVDSGEIVVERVTKP